MFRGYHLLEKLQNSTSNINFFLGIPTANRCNQIVCCVAKTWPFTRLHQTMKRTDRRQITPEGSKLMRKEVDYKCPSLLLLFSSFEYVFAGSAISHADASLLLFLFFNSSPCSFFLVPLFFSIVRYESRACNSLSRPIGFYGISNFTFVNILSIKREYYCSYSTGAVRGSLMVPDW